MLAEQSPAIAVRPPAETTAERPSRLLGVLRPLAIALPLFGYTWLGWLRFVPPFSIMPKGVALVLFTGWWLWRLWRRKALPRTPINGWLVAFLASATLSTVLSVDLRVSLDTLLDTVAAVLLFFVLCDLLLEQWAPDVLVDAILWFCSLVLLHSLWEVGEWYWEWYTIRVPGYPIWPVPFGRLHGIALNANLLSVILFLALPFGIVRLDAARGWGARSFWLLWLGGLDVVLVYTGGRGGWLAAAVATGVVVVYLLSRNGLPRRGRIGPWLRGSWRTGATLAAYLTLFVVVYLANPRDIVSTETGPESYHRTVASAATSGRIEVWRVAVEATLRSPIVGNGPWSYPWLQLRLGRDLGLALPNKTAHNVLLNVFVEQGLIGCAILTGLVVSASRPLVRRTLGDVRSGRDSHRSPIAAASLAALAAFAAQSLVDANTWLPANMILLVMIAALGLYESHALSRPAADITRWPALVLVVPCVLLVVFQRQYDAHRALADAYEAWWDGDVRAAARQMDRAVAADPRYTFYHEQRGLLYGALSETAPEPEDALFLEQARLSYRAAEALGLSWAPSLLNAAVLAERSGDAGALEAGISAWLPQWGHWPLPHMFLAEHLAEEGRWDDAESLLSEVLLRFPEARGVAACRSSLVCRTVADRMPEPEAPSAPWFDRAREHLGHGETIAAQYCVRLAAALPHSDAALDVLEARILLAEGETERAIRALELLLRPTVDSNSYDFVWHRIGTRAQLPSLALLDRTIDHLEAYRLLVELYHEHGRAQEALGLRAEAGLLARLLSGEAGVGAGIAWP